MSTNPTTIEDNIIEEVRKWRREAYEEDRAKSLVERARKSRELMKELGLDLRIATKILEVEQSQD